MTLLEKAKAARKPKPQRDMRVELAVAYANHEVAPFQVAAAIGIRETSVPSTMGATLITAIRRGEYRLVKVEASDAPHTL